MKGARAAPILAIAFAALLAGCMHPRSIEAPEGVRLTPLRSVSTLEAWIVLGLSGVKGVRVRNSVDCYRMEYPGVGADGAVLHLSGLLALPRGVAPRGLVSFQHGTTTTRSSVPSKPDASGLAAAVLFAGNGDVLVAPDYPGLGESPGVHPYYVADAIGPAIVAMIDFAERLEGVPHAPVFLTGFSEGAWASLAALRLLEAEGREVLGAALVAGAYDLRRVSLPAAMQGGSPSHSLYLAYLAWGYSAYYGRSLDSVLSDEYAARVGRLFEGASPSRILAELPADPRRMFNARFLDAFDHDGANWLLQAIAANSLIDVTPRAPVRLYYGSQDRDVVPEEALGAERAMRARGVDVTEVDLGPVTHDPSAPAAAPLVLAWLRELEAAEPR
jgi:hypothetical protein